MGAPGEKETVTLHLPDIPAGGKLEIPIQFSQEEPENALAFLQNQLNDGFKIVHRHSHKVKEGEFISVLLWREDE